MGTYSFLFILGGIYMISSFYKNFKIRDYMGDEVLIRNKKTIDCSLGTNPFIKRGYMDSNYNKLKSIIIKFIEKDFSISINSNNISFASWHNGCY